MKEEEKEELEKKGKSDSEKKNNWWKLVAIILIIIIIILLLLKSCGNGGKYKIKIHNGDEIIEVDKSFKLSDLVVDGGIASFLVDSDGNIVDPNSKLDPSKEYSVHIIPDGAERVKVTYKNGDWKLTVEYQKGAGLLFPKSPTKKEYVFLGWKDEKTNNYPAKMSPVNEDMTLVAQFGKSESEDGMCTLNCDIDKDGICDLNCDKDGDGKPDTSVDKDGDGKPDTNVDSDSDGVCDLNCDKDGDGNPDTNIDNNNDGVCDLNCDINNDGTCDFKCDTNGDGTCDTDCDIEWKTSKGVVWDVKCDGYYAWYAVQCTKTHGTCISLTIDGKEIEPNEEVKDTWVSFDWSDYVGSGKSFLFNAKYWQIDKTGQKYYYEQELTFEFEGNCVSNPESEVIYTCPRDYTLSDTKCVKQVTESRYASVVDYTCDSGYALGSDNKCRKDVEPTCPSGYTDGPNSCEKVTTVDASYKCNNPYTVHEGKCCVYNAANDSYECPGREEPRAYCESGQDPQNGKCTIYEYERKGCYNGATQKNDATAFICEVVRDASPIYSCSDHGSGFELNGSMCTKAYMETIDATKETN